MFGRRRERKKERNKQRQEERKIGHTEKGALNKPEKIIEINVSHVITTQIHVVNTEQQRIKQLYHILPATGDCESYQLCDCKCIGCLHR